MEEQNGMVMALLCEFVHWNVDVPFESIRILKTSGGFLIPLSFTSFVIPFSDNLVLIILSL